MVAVLGLFVAAVALLAPAYPQPQAYHAFADARAFLGVSNFANVVSNAGFLAVGWLGLRFLRGPGRLAFLEERGHWPYLAFFAGAVLTGLGSAYYHWAPTDDTLAWDRAAMTLVFSALVAAALADRSDSKAVLPAFLLIAALGVGTVAYWRASAALGAENVLPYLAFQAAACAATLTLTALPSRYTRRGDLWAAFLLYAAALTAEWHDHAIFALGYGVSGHTLKHLLAAAAMYWVLRMLMRRAPRGLPRKSPARRIE
ncbi:MAG: membrane protein [Burkholderiales bacterium]|nr:MAG: membrane protein [Burkholderiales bacterium]